MADHAKRLDLEVAFSVNLQPSFLLGGGGVLPIMAYTGRLHLRGVPFSGFRYIKG